MVAKNSLIISSLYQLKHNERLLQDISRFHDILDYRHDRYFKAKMDSYIIKANSIKIILFFANVASMEIPLI